MGDGIWIRDSTFTGKTLYAQLLPHHHITSPEGSLQLPQMARNLNIALIPG